MMPHFNKIVELTPADDAKGHEIISKVKAALEMARPLNSKVIELTFAGKNDEAIISMNNEARPAVIWTGC